MCEPVYTSSCLPSVPYSAKQPSHPANLLPFPHPRPCAAPHQQCQALLLFSHLLLGVLLPMVLITPPADGGPGVPVPRATSHPAASAGAGSGSPFNTACASGKALAAVEGRLRGWLRPFKWPAQRWQRGGPGAQAAFAARGWWEVVQRWLATTVVLWAVCCALYGGKE